MDDAAPAAAGDDTRGRAGYRRSAGSPRGEARRRELLGLVADDLAVNGLVDFSLRRAAQQPPTRWCSTTPTGPTTGSRRPAASCAGGAAATRGAVPPLVLTARR